MSRIHLAALSTENAYRVPWRFDRGDGAERPANCFTLRNLGGETLTAVTFNLYGSGVMPASAPARLESGDSLEIVISGHDLAKDTIGVIRWFRPNGQEYLWRVSF
ncbi:MAG TPA: hypothetical protein VHZ81_04590 [Galbitalea sp.]|jgi:hypothetical protein|nr:hypothetical protein [Galbitalea sp.]